MSFQFNVYAAAQWCTALVALAVALLVWRRRSSPGGRAFFLMMAAVFVWSTGSGLESAVVGESGKLLFSTIAYAGTVSVAPLFLVFALAYRGSGWRPSWWQLGALWLIPAATLVLAATNSAHRLVWTRLTPSAVIGSNIVIYGHGPWYFVSVAYYAVLALAAAGVIGRAVLRAQRLYIWQTVILLAGLAMPWIGTAIYLLPVNPFPGLDLPSIGFAATGLLLLLGMSRFRLLDVVPVARDMVVEKMTDGLVVLDARERIVDVNPAARALFGVPPTVIGQRLDDALAALSPALAHLRERGEAQVEISLPGDPSRHFDLVSSPLVDRLGAPSGRLLVIRDLTERMRMEREREKLVTDLTRALADIRSLRGLLPICSSCKKIRDDQGYWRTLEKYITEHSEAQFSHGLCPECLKQLYPEFASDGPEASR